MTTAVVICPGRGTYNAGELGYLHRHFPDAELLARFDAIREAAGQETLGALDGAERFAIAKHTRGDNASGLIFASSYGDFLAIDRDRIDVVAVTGNSMGWYTALACGGALPGESGFRVANTMGALMQQASIGGQTLYPWMGEDWIADPSARDRPLAMVAEIGARPGMELSLSIDLGGMLVLAGNAAALDAFENAVPAAQQRYPMRLGNHAGFHSALQAPVSAQALAQFSPDLFGQPVLPLIDGKGRIWWPGSSDLEQLHAYTFGAQITRTYDFTRAIAVAAREFAPDLFIVAGPGTTLGGAVAQSLIAAGWCGLRGKADFKARQDEKPLLVSMGMASQRAQAA